MSTLPMPFRIALLSVFATSTMAGCSKRASVWASRRDHLEIDVGAAGKLTATTLDGSQTAVGVDDHGGKVVVEADIRGGGRNKDDAQAALDAIKVAVTSEGEIIDVSWQWKTDKLPTWAAKVHFNFKLPPGLDVELVGRTGPVAVQNLSGNCVLTTRNGDVTARTSGARLEASTRNGELAVTTSAADVILDTQNGGISARLTTEGDIGGSLTTRNGGIVVALADTVSAMLDCSTSNGRIHCGLNLEQALAKQTSLKGSVRGGKKGLVIQTRNGSIKIE